MFPINIIYLCSCVVASLGVEATTRPLAGLCWRLLLEPERDEHWLDHDPTALSVSEALTQWL